ncbi:unnamed protein product [Cylicostephanus goldi]|uniref:Rap-GAP domain-containing protein n=1 Tax=Cylicostephanus goldi TaxID=71465 RepID=A0A3P7Q6Z4_CYLGO|nr:unnamed protein product [Cylicostephanus goldi]
MSPFLSVPDLNSGVCRQPSGDGRQVPGTLFTLGGNGMPETPPPMDGAGAKEERGPDRVHEEILRAMSVFFHIGQIDSDWGDPKVEYTRLALMPIISWTQLIIRHMYGKSGWLMRSFEEWPADFDQSNAMPRLASSLLLHYVNQPGAIRLGRKPNDEILQRSLRNLDRIPGIEYHAVGVLYMGMYQETEAQILANVYGSERYAKFLKLLGTPIPLDKHPGGLLPGQHGSYTYEYQDELSKIVSLSGFRYRHT